VALRVEERIVAGGEDDRLLVHHLVLRGPDRAIGRHLGEIARARYRLAPRATGDPLRVRRRRTWLRQNAPRLLERMLGLADALGVDPAGDAYDLGRVDAPSPGEACAAVFVPAGATGGGPLLVRVCCAGGREEPAPCATAGVSRPYVLETYPEDGRAALALAAFDPLGAALDGVNAEGLAVVAARDLESAPAGPLATGRAGVGLDEHELGRMLLDGCSTAREARDLLARLEPHYGGAPAHWLVADGQGDAFVFEIGPGPERAHLLEGEGRPVLVTNHPLHRYPGGAGLPPGPGPAGTYARYRALSAALARGAAPCGSPAPAGAGSEGGEGAGTVAALWTGIYDLRARALAATFFVQGRRAAEGGAAWPELRFGFS